VTWSSVVERVRDVPAGGVLHKVAGSRGIVTAAGRPHQLAGACALARGLREVGCSLPIHVFRAQGEPDPTPLARWFPDGVTFHTVEDPTLRGWQIKPFALQATSLDRCLWLDCDNLPLRDPTPLLEHDVLFWPDAYRSSDPGVVAAFGADPSSAEVESGQLVLATVAHARELAAVALLNGDLREHMYAVLHGDKDTFRLAFAALATPASTVAHAPTLVGERSFLVHLAGRIVDVRCRAGRPRDIGQVQHDLAGRRTFLHATVREPTPLDRSWGVSWAMPTTRPFDAPCGSAELDPGPLPDDVAAAACRLRRTIQELGPLERAAGLSRARSGVLTVRFAAEAWAARALDALLPRSAP